MRCKICDWAPSLPGSILKSGLPGGISTPPGAGRYDKDSGTYQCTHCAPPREDEEDGLLTFVPEYSEFTYD